MLTQPPGDPRDILLNERNEVQMLITILMTFSQPHVSSVSLVGSCDCYCLFDWVTISFSQTTLANKSCGVIPIVCETKVRVIQPFS